LAIRADSIASSAVSTASRAAISERRSSISAGVRGRSSADDGIELTAMQAAKKIGRQAR
jgi:hypothetical protein